MPGRCDPADSEGGMESGWKLTAKYAANWPNITARARLGDADQWKGSPTSSTSISALNREV